MTFGRKLQDRQDQRIDVVDVGGDVALYDRGVRVEVVFVGPHHEIDHHAVARLELIRIDEAEQRHVFKIQENILDDEDHDDRDHHGDGKLLRALHAEGVVNVPHVILVLRDRLRIHDGRHDGHDQRNAQRLEQRADEHQKKQEDHPALLLSVQYEVDLFHDPAHPVPFSLRRRPVRHSAAVRFQFLICSLILWIFESS
jgi:hypothetical protein